MPKKPARRRGRKHAASCSSAVDTDHDSRQCSLQDWINQTATSGLGIDRKGQMPELGSIQASPWRGELIESVESRVLEHLVATPLDAQREHLRSALESLGEYACTSGLLAISDGDTCLAVSCLRRIRGDDALAAQQLADTLESSPRRGRLFSLRELVEIYDFISRPVGEQHARRQARPPSHDQQPSASIGPVQVAVLRALLRGIRAAFYFRTFDQQNGLVD